MPARAAAFLVLILVVIAISAGCTGIPGPGHGRQAENSGKLLVYYLDVGQGDSELLRFGNRTILIDAGETEMGDRVVRDLRNAGATRIDLLVATHSHSDHIGGMHEVLDAFPVGEVLDAGVPSTSAIYEQFLKEVERDRIPYHVAQQGETIAVDPALQILVLSPPEKRLSDDPNENSVVLRVTYGATNFLFTGDLGGEAEDALVSSGTPLDAQVLKVGHHGSEYSTSSAFLARVNPGVAIIEVGKDNPYGHPHAATLERLTAAGATVYRTDRDGTILVRSDGVSYSVVTENGGGNIWSPGAATTATVANATETSLSEETLPPIPSLPTVPALPTVPPLPTLTGIPTVPPLPAIPDNATLPVTLPPVQIGNATSVYISAVQFASPGGSPDPDGQWVRVANRGNGPVLIAGWTLAGTNGPRAYTFPAVLLLPQGSVTVFAGSGTMNDTALYMGGTAPFWTGGDTAILRDGSGEVIDRKAMGAGP